MEWDGAQQRISRVPGPRSPVLGPSPAENNGSPVPESYSLPCVGGVEL